MLGKAFGPDWFQPALRRVGGGDGAAEDAGPRGGGFNPPSASSAEGTRLLKWASVDVKVSTRPPPRRRRGPLG